MTEDRLEDIALISIEHEIASSLDYATLIDSFSAVKDPYSCMATEN